MKIALLNSFYHPYNVGGAERSLQILAEALATQGHQVVVICLSEPKAGARKEEINGVQVYRVPLQNNYWPLANKYRRPSTVRRIFWHYRDRYNKAMARLVQTILRKEKPDLLHTHNITGFSVAIWHTARLLGLPVIHTLRDYSLLCPRNAYRNGRNCHKICATCWYFSIPKRKASSEVDLVVGVSKFTLKRHLEWGFFTRSEKEVVYNPVSFVLGAAPRSEAREAGPFRIGFLGRLAQLKGIEDLFEAVQQVSEQIPLRVLVAGRGEESYEAKLRKRAQGLPVEFLGYVEADAFLNQIDILVVPSRWHEPSPRVILEAYSNGIPVVASTRGGIPELVDEGQTGWLYDPDKPGALACALLEAYRHRDELRHMGMRGYKKSLAFTVEAHVKQYLELYQRITR